MTIKVSVICITEDRPWAMDFLWWNFKKQTLPPEERELIVIDTSAQDIAPRLFPGYMMLDTSLPHGSKIGAKYQRGLDLAQGEVVTFFDDDDYHGPHHLQGMWDAWIAKGKPDILRCVDPTMRWLNLIDWKYRFRKANIWAYFFYKAELAKQVPFNSAHHIGADTVWAGAMATAEYKRRQAEPQALYMDDVCILLSHTKNAANPIWKRGQRSWYHDVEKSPTMAQEEWDTFIAHAKKMREALTRKEEEKK